MFKKIVVCGLTVIFTGCASGPHKIELSKTFDANQAREMIKPGVNIVQGSALIRQNGGGVVTCAGLTILLVPATQYASERMTHIYGNPNRGYNPATRQLGFNPDEPDYVQLTQKTLCDAQGKFAFNKVADGDFFVVGNIVWNVGGPQGGSLMQKVSVANASVSEIVLSP